LGLATSVLDSCCGAVIPMGGEDEMAKKKTLKSPKKLAATKTLSQKKWACSNFNIDPSS